MSDRFSVLHVSASSMLGGAERVVLDLMTWQRKHRPSWDLSLVAPESGPLIDATRALGVRTTILPLAPGLARLGESGQSPNRLLRDLPYGIFPAWRSVRDLKALAASSVPQVIHSHGLKTHALLALGRIRDAHLVWHMHDYISARPTSLRLLRALARRCDMAIAISESVATDLHHALPRLPVTTVLNGVDVAGLMASGPSAPLDELSGLPAPPDGTLRIGLLGTFARWKGHQTFLRALAELRGEQIRGYVIGAPVYQTKRSQYSLGELQLLSSTLGLGDRAGFPGFIADRAAALRALDIVVHASTEPEPFGLVIAEAMAVGKPVIVSPLGGARELVRPGVDALTHCPGDVLSLAAAIRELVSSAALRARIGAAAQNSASERFCGDRAGGEVAAAYLRATARSPAA